MKGAHSLWERQVTGLPAHRRVVASLFSPTNSACGVIKTANMVCLQRVRQEHESVRDASMADVPGAEP